MKRFGRSLDMVWNRKRVRETEDKDVVEEAEWFSSGVRISVYIGRCWQHTMNKNPKVLSTDHSPNNLTFYTNNRHV